MPGGKSKSTLQFGTDADYENADLVRAKFREMMRYYTPPPQGDGPQIRSPRYADKPLHEQVADFAPMGGTTRLVKAVPEAGRDILRVKGGDDIVRRWADTSKIADELMNKPGFKEWFGDAVMSYGRATPKPRVLFHGTPYASSEAFDQFHFLKDRLDKGGANYLSTAIGPHLAFDPRMSDQFNYFNQIGGGWGMLQYLDHPQRIEDLLDDYGRYVKGLPEESVKLLGYTFPVVTNAKNVQFAKQLPVHNPLGELQGYTSAEHITKLPDLAHANLYSDDQAVARAVHDVLFGGDKDAFREFLRHDSPGLQHYISEMEDAATANKPWRDLPAVVRATLTAPEHMRSPKVESLGDISYMMSPQMHTVPGPFRREILQEFPRAAERKGVDAIGYINTVGTEARPGFDPRVIIPLKPESVKSALRPDFRVDPKLMGLAPTAVGGSLLANELDKKRR